MLDHLTRALVWADGHGLTVPVILGAITVLARLAWAGLRPSVLRRWPGAVPVVEGAAARVAALLPDVLAAILRRRPAAPSGRSGEAGRATVGTLVVLASVGLVASVACRPVREAIIDTQSPRVACAPTSQRCHDGAPEVCSATGRWWPALSRHADGTPRTCVGSCRIEDGDAYCSPLVEGDPR
jgi:hypothetical protein